MKLSIIIVSWNVCEDLVNCLQSIKNFSPAFEYETIVVDNASSDQTIKTARERFPDITLLENQNNLGFAAANNIGIKHSAGDYVLFLNPDTEVLADSLGRLVEYMEAHADVGICGPKILNEDRTLQRSVRRFPTFRGAMFRYTFLKFTGLFKRHFHYWHWRDFNYDNESDVQQLIGAALMCRRSVIEELDGFDERYFMYYEEVDLCLRTICSGKRVVYFPGTEIIHYGGKSAAIIPGKVRLMTLRSLIAYFRKNQPGVTTQLFLLFFKLGILSRLFVELLLYSIEYIVDAMCLNVKRRKLNGKRVTTAFEFLYRHYIQLVFS